MSRLDPLAIEVANMRAREARCRYCLMWFGDQGRDTHVQQRWTMFSDGEERIELWRFHSAACMGRYLQWEREFNERHQREPGHLVLDRPNPVPSRRPQHEAG